MAVVVLTAEMHTRRLAQWDALHTVVPALPVLAALLTNKRKKQESYTVVTMLLECLTSQTSCNPANSEVKFRSWALVPDAAKQCDTTSTALAGKHTHMHDCWTRRQLIKSACICIKNTRGKILWTFRSATWDQLGESALKSRRVEKDVCSGLVCKD